MSNMKYDESSIQTLTLQSGIRLRPSTFIERLGKIGINKMVLELVQNANDEVSSGHSDKVEVHLNSKIPEISVKDYGRGIPLAKLHELVTTIYSGSKYNEDTYSTHSGANGMGLAICNALSDYMIFEVIRPDQSGKLSILNARYEKGEKINLTIKPYSGTDHGTRVTMKPSLDIFFGKESGFEDTGTYFDPDEIEDVFDVLAFLNPGTRIELTLDGKKKTFLFSGSFKDYLHKMMHHKHVKPMTDDTFEFHHIDPISKIKLDVVLLFSKDIDKELYWSYVNKFPSPGHGRHVDGTRAAVSRVITLYLKNHDYVPKSAKYTVSGADVVDNVVGIVMTEMSNALFDGQTKSRLTSETVYKVANDAVYTAFSNWANSHPSEMDKVCKYAVLKAKAENAAKEAKIVAMDPANTKSSIQAKANLKKFTNCVGTNPMKNELFIVEGDSAGGSAAQARDPNTQAILRLRGKVLNVANKSNGLSEELESIITVLGIGCGSKTNYDKLKFHKIIILTDADPDGAHISSLLLTFFLTYYPYLIENGHVFIANPPFYQVCIQGSKRKLNIINEKYFEYYKMEIALKMFRLLDYQGREFSNKDFKAFLSHLIGFNTFVDNYAKELNVESNLLELIVRSFDQILSGKFQQLRAFGYDCKIVEKTKSYVILEFDKGFIHSFVKIDPKFYTDIYLPIFKRMKEIVLSDPKLHSIKTGTIYTAPLVQLADIIDSTMEGKGVELKRYKGCGEMSHQELGITAMNPDTRMVTRVTLKDAQKAKDTMEILMGSSRMLEKKKMLYESV